MTDSANENATQPDSSDFPSAPDRIKQLNDIDKDVIKLLHAAGTAINALTPNSQEDDKAAVTQKAHEEALLTPSKEYLSLLDSIRTRVRRQIMALEEAGIISVDSTSRTVPSTAPPLSSLGTSQAPAEKNGAISGGHLGSLDVSWLNARNNRVGEKRAADIRREAEAFLKRVGGKADAAEGNEKMDTT